MRSEIINFLKDAMYDIESGKYKLKSFRDNFTDTMMAGYTIENILLPFKGIMDVKFDTESVDTELEISIMSDVIKKRRVANLISTTPKMLPICIDNLRYIFDTIGNETQVAFSDPFIRNKNGDCCCFRVN